MMPKIPISVRDGNAFIQALLRLMATMTDDELDKLADDEQAQKRDGNAMLLRDPWLRQTTRLPGNPPATNISSS